MKLPNASQLVVEREKITDYLLNPAHPYGAGKAEFFSRMGFHSRSWEVLANAFRDHGRMHEVAQVTETGFGPRYSVEGEMRTPGGRCPQVRSVWQWDKGAVAPRLITAYPLDDK